jgi:hypothetical protein
MRRPLLPIAVFAFISLAVLAAGCNEGSPGPSPVPCTYAFVPPSAAVESAGGDGIVQVVTTDACNWTVSSTVSWITLPSGNSARGSASVAYRVAANASDSARSGALRIENTTFNITQTGRVPCTYEVAPSDFTVAAVGGSGTFTVSTQTQCPWTAVANASWLTVTEGAEGAGTGTVKFTAARYDGDDPRSATIAVAGRIVTVTQEAVPESTGPCDYSVSPADIRLHWHQEGAQFSLTTDPHCDWTANPAAGAWLSLTTPTEGAGSALMKFANSIYTGLQPRRAAIEVRWPTETAGQNVWVTQEGCWYALAPDVRDIGAAGGTSQITVLASPGSVDCMVGCPWTAQSLAPWIEVTSSMPKAGDDLLIFRVAPNTTGQPREGQIRIEHMFLTVRQAGQ